MFFAGGADVPFSYSGIGYGGTPASPTRETFLYYPESNRWERGPDLPTPSMDHRGLAGGKDRLFLAGGMTVGRVVSSGLLAARISGGAAITWSGILPPP